MSSFFPIWLLTDKKIWKGTNISEIFRKLSSSLNEYQFIELPLYWFKTQTLKSNYRSIARDLIWGHTLEAESY